MATQIGSNIIFIDFGGTFVYILYTNEAFSVSVTRFLVLMTLGFLCLKWYETNY